VCFACLCQLSPLAGAATLSGYPCLMPFGNYLHPHVVCVTCLSCLWEPGLGCVMTGRCAVLETLVSPRICVQQDRIWGTRATLCCLTEGAAASVFTATLVLF
jgi:hypothetical protein